MGRLVLFATYGFIFWLMRRDMNWRKAGSWALLIPGVWLAVQGSRPLSYWLGGGSGEGHPANILYFLLFLILGVAMLLKVGLNWGALIARNKAIFLLYGFLLLSVVWSELPLSSFKRIIKDFETVLMGLVLLAAAVPAEAIRILYVRVAYVLFPLSAVFIKYFPDIGRQSTRAGENMFTGVTTQKNSLGLTVFVCSLMVLWDLVEIHRGAPAPGRKQQLAVRAGLLVLGVWLLITCDSQTSLLCLLLGSVLFWACGRLVRMRNGKAILITGLIAVIALAALDSTLGLKEIVIRAMGRDPSLTGRTDIWRMVMEQETDPLLGTGFCVFWNTDKGINVVDALMQINSAHNGYLEMYLDGGLVGASLLVLLLLVAGHTAISRLFSGHPLGRMGLIFWFLVIIYNFSESSFFRLDVLWFTFLLLMLECPVQQRLGRRALQPSPSAGMRAEYA